MIAQYCTYVTVGMDTAQNEMLQADDDIENIKATVGHCYRDQQHRANSEEK